MWKLVAPVLLAPICTAAIANPAETVEGRWLTQGKSAVVEIYRCASGELCGRLLWYRIKPTDPDPQTADTQSESRLAQSANVRVSHHVGLTTGKLGRVDRRLAL